MNPGCSCVRCSEGRRILAQRQANRDRLAAFAINVGLWVGIVRLVKRVRR